MDDMTRFRRFRLFAAKLADAVQVGMLLSPNGVPCNCPLGYLTGTFEPSAYTASYRLAGHFLMWEVEEFIQGFDLLDPKPSAYTQLGRIYHKRYALLIKGAGMRRLSSREGWSRTEGKLMQRFGCVAPILERPSSSREARSS